MGFFWKNWRLIFEDSRRFSMRCCHECIGAFDSIEIKSYEPFDWSGTGINTLPLTLFQFRFIQQRDFAIFRVDCKWIRLELSDKSRVSWSVVGAVNTFFFFYFFFKSILCFETEMKRKITARWWRNARFSAFFFFFYIGDHKRLGHSIFDIFILNVANYQ